MYVTTTVAAGIVGTCYMTGLQWGVERLRLVKGNMTQAVGTFVIPERLYTPLVALALHLVAGTLFAFFYGYVFDFVKPYEVRDFMQLGGLIGFVHGFFVSYFMMMGFSDLQWGGTVHKFGFPAAVLNIGGHLLYGITVGVGFGVAALSGTVVWYMVYGLLGAAALGGLIALLTAPVRKHRPIATATR